MKSFDNSRSPTQHTIQALILIKDNSVLSSLLLLLYTKEEKNMQLMNFVLRPPSNQKNDNSIVISPILNIEEAGRFLDVDVSTLYNWVKEKHLPYFKIGKRRFFKVQDLLEWADSFLHSEE